MCLRAAAFNPIRAQARSDPGNRMSQHYRRKPWTALAYGNTKLPSRIALVTTPGTGRQEDVASIKFSDRPFKQVFSREGYPVYQIVTHVRQLLTSEDGPAAVEYAVMLSLILVACIAIVTSLGQSVNSTFSSVNTSIGS